MKLLGSGHICNSSGWEVEGGEFLKASVLASPLYVANEKPLLKQGRRQRMIAKVVLDLHTGL